MASAWRTVAATDVAGGTAHGSRRAGDFALNPRERHASPHNPAEPSGTRRRCSPSRRPRWPWPWSSSAPPDASSATWRSAIVRGLLRQTASGFATTNLWAETAWTGFVQARLQARRGGLPAAVGTAALCARQHLPLLAASGSGVELAVI